MRISVIIPVYNAEKTLQKTLDALKKQTAEDIEFVLVDNASLDNSASICKKTVEEDNRFRYVYEPRKGVSAARNTGIKEASGECLCFCDADDLPDKDMYRILCDDLKNHDTDIVMCNYFSERDEETTSFPKNMSGLLNKQEIKEKLIPAMFGAEAGGRSIWGTVWRCALKKQIVVENNLLFDEKLSFSEDLCFVLSYLNKSETVFLENKSLYFYAMTEGSAMLSFGKFKSKMFEERLHLINTLQSILEEQGIYRENQSIIDSIFQEYILECVGNTATVSDENSFSNALKRMKQIVKEPVVKEVFNKLYTDSIKKKIAFTLIQKRMALLLLIYFRIRRK